MRDRPGVRVAVVFQRKAVAAVSLAGDDSHHLRPGHAFRARSAPQRLSLGFKSCLTCSFLPPPLKITSQANISPADNTVSAEFPQADWLSVLGGGLLQQGGGDGQDWRRYVSDGLSSALGACFGNPPAQRDLGLIGLQACRKKRYAMR